MRSRFAALAVIGSMIGCGDIREVAVPVEGDASTSTAAATTGTGGIAASSSDSAESTEAGGSTEMASSTSTGAGGEGPISLCADAPALVDPATGEVELGLDVTGVESPTDLDVSMRLHHEEVGQIEVRLVRDSGASVLLFPRLDRNDCTPDLSVHFDDEGDTDAGDACEADTTDGARVRVVPQEELSTLLRGGVADHWRLVVTDHHPEPAGELSGFCLSFTTRS